jgi:hypothetical protein
MAYYLNKNSGNVWVGDHIREGTNKQLGGTSSSVSIAVSQKEAGSTDRDYHIFQIDSSSGRLSHGKLSPPYQNAGDADHIRTYRLHDGTTTVEDFGVLTDVWGMVGADEGLDTAPRSIPPEKDRTRLYFYTADGQGVINGYVRDEIDVNWKVYGRGANRPLSSVRVVQSPKPVVNDPDDKIDGKELPGILRDTDYIVYGAIPDDNRNDGRIYVDYRRWPEGKKEGKTALLKDGWAPGPRGLGPSYLGISVDKRYVWLYTSWGFACATHASVMRCLEGKIASPGWILSDPACLKEKRLGNLCSCDDSTLLAALLGPRDDQVELRNGGWPLYTGAYDVDLKNRKIAVKFAPCENGAKSYRSDKVRLSCWPLLEDLMQYLQERVGDSSHVPH